MDTEHAPLIVIAGPRGAGKGTILHALVRELGLLWIPTHTTENNRMEDQDLSHHVFDTETTFERYNERQEFILPTSLGKTMYATMKRDIDDATSHNHPAVIETTVPEALAINKLYSFALLFYIQTDIDVCKLRLKQGNIHADDLHACFVTTDEDFKTAKSSFDYMIEGVDGHPEEAIEAIKEIIVEHYPNLTEKAV